jgi:hypothetical protein
MAIVADSVPVAYGFGASLADDAGRVPPAYQPEPDRDRRIRDEFALPQLRRHHEALLAARAMRDRSDLSASEQQRRQLLADYRAIQSEADWLRARLLAWHPELLADDPLTQLHGVALDLEVMADRMEAAESDWLAMGLRDAATACREAVGGATGPLPHPAPEPHIAANHSCQDGGLCAACQEHDTQLIEIERQERAKGRTR